MHSRCLKDVCFVSCTLLRTLGGYIIVSMHEGCVGRTQPDCPTQVVKRKGEYLFGIAPCLAALQAKRRKVHAIFLKQGGEGNKKREIKKQVMRYQN